MNEREMSKLAYWARELKDLQNGPPLVRDTEDWNKAMEGLEKALEPFEKTEEKLYDFSMDAVICEHCGEANTYVDKKPDMCITCHSPIVFKKGE